MTFLKSIKLSAETFGVSTRNAELQGVVDAGDLLVGLIRKGQGYPRQGLQRHLFYGRTWRSQREIVKKYSGKPARTPRIKMKK